MSNRTLTFLLVVVLVAGLALTARAGESPPPTPAQFLFVRATLQTVNGKEATGIEVRDGVCFQTIIVDPAAPGAQSLSDKIKTLKADQSILVRRSTDHTDAWLADVRLASEKTAFFYVDPDYSGSDKDGAPVHPWTSMTNQGAWQAVNAALATGDVTVYFSARKADRDTDEAYGDFLHPMRTDGSTHRLTLDGMSKYSTNSADPVWADNRGMSKCALQAPNSNNCIHWTTLQNYLTIKGFRGKGMAHLYGGDHFIFRDNVIEGFTTYQYAHYRHEHLTNGGCKDLAFIGNDLHNPTGEGLYIGGAGNTNKSGHDAILVEGNTLHDCGDAGGEGDGLDIKDNNTRVVVRYNVIRDNRHSGCTSHSGGQWYANVVYNNPIGMFFTTYWGRIDGLLIYNNLVYANTAKGIKVNCDSGDLLNARICNNTAAANATSALEFSANPACAASVTLQNNIATGSAQAVVKGGVWTRFVSDHNDWHGTVSGIKRDATDINADPLFVGTAPYSAASFRLQHGSPCIDAGAAIAEFQDDHARRRRPQGERWDMGAYEYSPNAASPRTTD